MARKDLQDDDSRDENLGKDSDDNFGLPEINYEPLRKEEETRESESSEPENQPEYTQSEEPVAKEEEQPSAYENQGGGYGSEEQQPATYSYKSYAEEESSVWPKVLGILFVIILALGATWYFAIYKPKQDQIAEKERIEAQQRAKHDVEGLRCEVLPLGVLGVFLLECVEHEGLGLQVLNPRDVGILIINRVIVGADECYITRRYEQQNVHG